MILSSVFMAAIR